MGFDLRRQFHWHRRNLDRQLSYLARRRQRHDQRTTAYLWYVSPTQINLQVPNITAVGPVTVVVTGPNGTVSSTVTLAQFAPAFNLLDAKHVAGIILRSNGSGAYGGGSDDVIGRTASSLGYATVAAKAGDIVELFGVGFGPTSISFQ